jgi:hypothetical protein
MTELVRVRGLNRRGVRINTGRVTNQRTSVIDLDNGKTRSDLSHHSAIGQLIVVGDATTAVASGAVSTNGTTTTISTSAGTLLREDGTTVTIGAQANQALASAPDATNPRIDLVLVNNGSGAVTQQAGTAAATPVIPRPTGDVTVLATVRVSANATTPAGVVITDVAPRLA